VPNNELEFQKLIFEIFKHLTTLNTGVAVIVPVVAKTLDLPLMISVRALECFFFSVIFSGLGMCITAWRVKGGPPKLLILMILLLAAAWVFIIAGVVYFSARTIQVHPG
jgi:hypothetical protein